MLLHGLSHTSSYGNRFLLVSPTGTAVMVVDQYCEGVLRRVEWDFDDEASAQPAGASDECAETSHRWRLKALNPNNSMLGAPAAPYATKLSAFDGASANGVWKLYFLSKPEGISESGYLEGYDLAITMVGAKVATASNPKLKFKKSGKSKIAISGRAVLGGAAVSAGECGGSVKSRFTQTITKRKKKKTVTVASFDSPLTFVAGACGVDFSTKLKKKYSGAKLTLSQTYLGGDFIAPFNLATSERVKKIKFK